MESGRPFMCQKTLQYINENSFCLFLTLNEELFVSHINLVAQENKLFGHLSLANPHSRQLKNGSRVIAIFNNKIHLLGEIILIDDESQLMKALDGLVSKNELSRSNPWKVDWNDPKFTSLLKGIVAFYVKPIQVDIEYSTINLDYFLNPVIPALTPSHFIESRPDVLNEYLQKNLDGTVFIFDRCVKVHICHINMRKKEIKQNTFLYEGEFEIPSIDDAFNVEDKLQALVVFTGPHTYISPSSYKSISVPTWNYVVIHLTGILKVIHQEENNGLVKYQIEFETSNIVGKFKLSQNRSYEDRESVIKNLCLSDSAYDQELGCVMKKSIHYKVN